jgi:hypothetical protein
MRMKKLRVTLHLKSGRKIVFFCSNVKWSYNTSTDRLTKIETEDAEGWPPYFCFDDVSAMTKRLVWRWATLPDDQ